MIPYENKYRQYLAEREMYPDTIDRYCILLAQVLDRIAELNIVYETTKDPRKISVEDLIEVFEEFQYKYAVGTFNKYHTIVNGYWKFLVTDLRLKVPPLSWVIQKEQLTKFKKYPNYDWDDLTDQVIHNDEFSDAQKAAFIFTAKGLSRTQIINGTSELGDMIPYTKSEESFINALKETLKDVDDFKNHGIMVLSANYQKTPQRTTFNNMLAHVLNFYQMTEKRGTLISDARIYNTAKNDWNERDVERIYNLVANLKTNTDIVRESKHRKLEKAEKISNSP